MFTWFNLREALIVIGLVAASPILVANPAPAPSRNPSTPAPAGFIVLTQPVKVKIAYGEITLPAAMRLPVISSDATSVRVNYMGEVQIIPIAAARFEKSTSESPDAGIALTTPNISPQPVSQTSSTPASQLQLLLQPGYDSRMQGGDITVRELQLLLSPHCTEAVDLSGAGIKIYNGVDYLMDSEQAVAALRLTHAVPSRVPLATPGFPKNSLYYIGYDGGFEGHFNRLYLVTDAASKVVAVQLLDEHPKSKWKSPASLAAASWSTYNFVNARMRASDLMRVQAVAKRQGGAIMIETQMYQRVRSKVGHNAIERTKSRKTQNYLSRFRLPASFFIAHEPDYPRREDVFVSLH